MFFYGHPQPRLVTSPNFQSPFFPAFGRCLQAFQVFSSVVPKFGIQRSRPLNFLLIHVVFGTGVLFFGIPLENFRGFHLVGGESLFPPPNPHLVIAEGTGNVNMAGFIFASVFFSQDLVSADPPVVYSLFLGLGAFFS